MKRIISLAILVFTAIVSQAQIPNNGFEDWTQPIGTTYWTPDNWGCLNSITAPLNVFTCERGTPGNPGNYYIKVTSKTVAGVGVIPGIAVSGNIDTTTFLPTNGFAFNQRPTKLTGKWQHMIFGSSQGYIDVELSKWNTGTNSRDIIAYTHTQLSSMAMSWANFTINLNYQSTDTPDSCMIVLAASGSAPTNLDYLWVDNLAFTGIVGINEANPVDASLKIFPNPCHTEFAAEITCNEPGNGLISLTDMNGKQVFCDKRFFEKGKNNIRISISDLHLAAGEYIVGITKNNKLLQQRLVIQ